MNSRDQLHKKAQKSRKEKDWAIYKKQRNKCNNLIKKLKLLITEILLRRMRQTSKKFWNCIKAVFPSKLCHLQTCPSVTLNSNVKTFSDYFSGAVKKLKSLTYPLGNCTW